MEWKYSHVTTNNQDSVYTFSLPLAYKFGLSLYIPLLNNGALAKRVDYQS